LTIGLVVSVLRFAPVYAIGIARVQGNARGTSQSTYVNCTLTLNPTPGNLLLATFAIGPNVRVSGITERGVSWAFIIRSYFNLSGVASEIWGGNVSAGASTSINASLDATATWGAVIDVCEYSGVSIVDQIANNTGTLSDTGTTATTIYNNELWVGVICDENPSQLGNPTNGFTMLDGLGYGSTVAVNNAYFEKIVSATGRANSGDNAAGSFAGCMATFYGIPESLQVYPGYIFASDGQSFEASIRIYNVTDGHHWVFSISWNPDVLEFVSITEGDFLSRGGTTSGIQIGAINQTGGYLKDVACSLMGSGPGVDGSGTLAMITFKANNSLAVGSSDLNIYLADIKDSNGSSVPCNIVNGFVDVGVETLSLTPTTLVSPGLQRLTLNLSICNVMHLHLWVATIQWNSSVLNLTSYSEGPFLKQAGQTTFIVGKVAPGLVEGLTCSLQENVPGMNGNGTLSTFQFNATAFGWTDISITFSDLLSSSGTSMTHYVSNSTAIVFEPSIEGEGRIPYMN